MKFNFKKFFYTIRIRSYIPISYAIISSLVLSPYVTNQNFNKSQQVISKDKIEQKISKDDYTKNFKLPLYNIYEALLNDIDEAKVYLAENINDFKNENPWNENIQIDNLPIFINKYSQTETGLFEHLNINKTENLKIMKNQILKIGKSFNVNIEENNILKTIKNKNGQETICGFDKNINDNCIKIFYETNKIRISVNGDLSASVEFLEPLSLPSGYGYGIYPTYEQINSTGNYIKNNYKNLLMMENPTVDICKKGYDTYKNQIYSLEFYEKGQDTKNSIINYGLKRVRVYCNNNSITYIRFSNFELTDKLGDYPIISAKKARETAVKANLHNPFFNNPDSQNDIIKTELTYLEYQGQELLMPFYKIYVKLQNENYANSKDLGLTEYSVCYIPAVDEKYLIYSY